jgi:hypothetical protein
LGNVRKWATALFDLHPPRRETLTLGRTATL